MNDYFKTLTDDEKAIFSAISEHAFSLGYKAKKDKSKTLSYTFTHSKVKKTLLRFSTERGRPIIKIKFFAENEYSNYFHEAIRAVIEEYDYRYTGCYDCRKFDGTQGYRYRYPDGREYYRCGTELIDLADILNLPLPEFLELFKKQHEFYTSKASQENVK